MKKPILLVLFSLALFAEQTKVSHLHEVSLLFGNSENGFEQNIDRSDAYELQYQYNGLDFPIKPEIDLVYSQDIPLYHTIEARFTRYLAMMVNGVYEIPYSDLLTPYLKAGTGFIIFDDVPDSPASVLLADAGAGLKLHLNDQWALKFEVATLFGDDYSNILATGGISFAFGHKDDAAPEQIEQVTPLAAVSPAQQTVAKQEQVPTPSPVIATTATIKKEPAPLYIRFASGRALLSEKSKASVKQFSRDFIAYSDPEKYLYIVGHTDNIGTDYDNATLAIQRANTLKAEFIKAGIDPQHITIDTKGEIDPAASNATEEGRAENRRAVVIIQNHP